MRAGRKRYCIRIRICSGSEGRTAPTLFHEKGTTFPTGNQLSTKLKRKMSRMPMKNVGSEKVVRELVTQKLSAADPLFLEITIPMIVPRMIENTVDVPIRRSVFSSLPDSIIRLVTG